MNQDLGDRPLGKGARVTLCAFAVGVFALAQNLQTLGRTVAAAGSASKARNTSEKEWRRNSTLGGEEEQISRVCARVEESLDVRSWAPVRYHKDQRKDGTDGMVDERFVGTVEQDDADARATIRELNRIKNSSRPVLTRSLLDAGVRPGGRYRALRFAERLATSRGSDRPLQIAVFGNSFTIGSNCGESTIQREEDCAWPNRLSERWKELFSSPEGSGSPPDATVDVDWHMWQENAQGSIIIAQKLPAFIEYFRSKNLTVDAILIDCSITEGTLWPWFEAVVRAFLQIYPGVVIFSIIGANKDLVAPSGKYAPVEMLRKVQQKYELAVVDIAKMVNVLRDENNTAPDRLWPQGLLHVTASGEEVDDPATDDGELYWPNFVPRVRKKKHAYYANNHPPWPTHQYVADVIANAFLRTAALGCASTGENRREEIAPSLLPEDTVASKEQLSACPLCLNPLSRIDAKAPPDSGSGVVGVVCGDWRWVTDERHRAGWQSDEVGSLIRFRLRIGADPLIVLTYTGSHETFGDFRVTFRTPDKVPLSKCFDISNNTATLPSLRFDSLLPQYTLPKVVSFPGKSEDFRTVKEWQLLNETVLSQRKARTDQENGVDEVDLYVENTGGNGRTRVKIQMISAC